MRRMFTLGHIPAATEPKCKLIIDQLQMGISTITGAHIGNVNPYTDEPGTLTSQHTDTAEAAADNFEDDGESDPDYDL